MTSVFYSCFGVMGTHQLEFITTPPKKNSLIIAFYIVWQYFHVYLEFCPATPPPFSLFLYPFALGLFRGEQQIA